MAGRDQDAVAAAERLDSLDTGTYGLTIATTGSGGKALVNLAEDHGRADVARRLKELGDAAGLDPTDRATMYGQMYTAKGDDTQTVLMHAAACGSPAILRLVIASGVGGALADFDEGCRTALCYAAEAGCGESVRALIGAGADPGSEDCNFTTILMSAAKGGIIETLGLVMASGRAGPIDRVDCDGYTALHYAARAGHSGAMRALLAAGADARALASGRTCLMLAAASGSADAVSLVLSADPEGDINATDARCATALHCALEVLPLSDRDSFLSVVRVLVAAGADCAARMDTGETPLMMAARNGCASSVDALLTSGRCGDTEAGSHGDSGQSALHLAAQSGSKRAIQRLLQAGADASSAGPDGSTLLMSAAASGRAGAVEAALAATGR